MRFRKLRLAGFKSFVEPAEMIIEPGLTGIVGPNGCGKSNLLEALRWVMGENSSKSMRASAMDDVIFAGSAQRPARAFAEVTLTLDNTSRSAPEPWKEFDAIEVSRRIMREKGSTYRINGREVRARDVQLLFADAGTGARSPALVRQGRISELINAKPQARRRLLEEAAGIVGLYTRRHEAELKLNAAEQNLARLEDVLAQLEQQVNNLTRQARQAARYRELSDSIRQHEAALLWRNWREAAEQQQRAEAEQNAATTAQADAVYQASLLAKEVDLLKEKIAPLREAAAKKAAAVQRIKLELEGLSRQEKAAAARRRELAERIEQAERDLARLAEDAKESTEAIERISAELAEVEAQGEDAGQRDKLAAALQQAEAATAAAQEKLDVARARLAEREAEDAALRRRLEEAQRRKQRLDAEREALAGKLRAVREKAQASGLEALASVVAEAEQTVRQAEEQAAASAAAEQAAREALEQARGEAHERQRALDTLRAEISTIEKMLGTDTDSGAATSVLDSLKVQSGYEAALAAALGDDAEAGLNEKAAAHWRALPPMDMPALPKDTAPLADFVDAPPALERRLASIGVVDNAMLGHTLQPALQPGQRLVTREGDLWRWDGFTAAHEAPTAAARRLQARNRLDELRREEKQAQAAFEQAEQARAKAREALEKARREAGEAREAERTTRRALEDARRQLERQRQQAEGVQRELAALEATEQRLQQETAAAEEALQQAEAAQASLQPADALREEVSRLQTALDEARSAERNARQALDALDNEARLRAERIARLRRERDDWQRRQQRAGQHRAELQQRLDKLRRQQQELANAPDSFGDRREKLFATLKEAEQQAAAASDALAEAERTLLEKERDWREAETRLADAKAALAAVRERAQNAEQRLQEAVAALRERLQCTPQQALAKTSWTEQDCPDRVELERALNTARSARERLGAVNLRAETELNEAREELQKLASERDDVQQAVDKLRGAIASLNREGRKRLLEAFEEVNRHFTALFTTLFGGGKAHLELIESDDPLQAGLEIFAQPPGKRLQTLSLLSGGEQTLTALALIFAVFLVNPSPICVLDEVDAPLDEHNVERFCNLLDDMLKRAPTDFLIITHHPLTMARMHRLFGVTMMEPGVSRLVSVDLQTAEQLREAS